MSKLLSLAGWLLLGYCLYSCLTSEDTEPFSVTFVRYRWLFVCLGVELVVAVAWFAYVARGLGRREQ